MRTVTRLRSVFAVLAIASSFVLAGPAAGQATTSDPYGPTVPPTEPPGDPTCTVDDAGVEVGGTVTGSIAGLEAGTEVELVLGGETLATVVSDAEGEAAFAFELPAVGALVAVGVTFTVDCGAVDPGAVLGEGVDRPEAGAPAGGGGGSGGAVVLGEQADRPGGGAGGTGSGAGGSGRSALARTGATLLPLVALALAALVVGAYLRRRSRGRLAL